jgi:hypothetical protein
MSSDKKELVVELQEAMYCLNDSGEAFYFPHRSLNRYEFQHQGIESLHDWNK